MVTSRFAHRHRAYAARGISRFMPPAELCRTGPVRRVVVTPASALAYVAASVPFGIVCRSERLQEGKQAVVRLETG